MNRFSLAAIMLSVAIAAGCRSPQPPPTEQQPPATEQQLPGATAPAGETAGTRPGQAPAATPEPPAALAPPPEPKPAPPEYREITVPAGTTISAVLETGVASNTSSVEDSVRASVASAVVVDGLTAIPANAALSGSVTEAVRSAKVKGRARVAFRFTGVELAGGEGARIQTATIAREAEATKKQDAKKIGIGAAAGAVIGGIAGGGDGAAAGAAIGGGAGTVGVLATRGKEISVPAGTRLQVKLTSPLTVRVRVR